MNEGKQAALRQWKGLFTGFALVSLGSVLVNAFLGNVLGTHVRYLTWAGAAYLLKMAWNMIRPVFFPGFAEKYKQDRSVGKSSFWTGLFVQLTNIKIIVFCMTALSLFVLPYTQDFLNTFVHSFDVQSVARFAVFCFLPIIVLPPSYFPHISQS